jgi:hypothetical protein
MAQRFEIELNDHEYVARTGLDGRLETIEVRGLWLTRHRQRAAARLG